MNRFFQKKRETTFRSLRSALHMSSASEKLDNLPDRFAKVIEQFDSLNVDPNFREAIFQILNGSVDVALSMVDETFPVEQANNAISNQLSILGRALSYLQSRPSSQGFSILLPERGQLVGHFTTREEAEDHLTRYQNLGISRNCLVVPTKILSLHAIQPTPRVSPTSIPSPLEGPELPVAPLPVGIVPDNSLNLSPEKDLSLRPSEGPGPTLSLPPDFIPEKK
jgi:hypothetical protein